MVVKEEKENIGEFFFLFIQSFKDAGDRFRSSVCIYEKRCMKCDG